ncbi:MAG: type II secretion system protein [Candidatus Microgenomates bacterium]|jgi:prepilin-type N-terminal cleavage/methylation domain-containing protein
MKKTLAQAFTLVELLIVIALLGVIATIVIAAINPIEQANKARDAGMKADASQLESAIQRYYASQNAYPWEDFCKVNTSDTNCGSGNALAAADAELPFTSADNEIIGLCGLGSNTGASSTCRSNPTQGLLISSLELQVAFLSKSWIGGVGTSNQLLVGKAGGASSSVYVCWVPLSTANRQVLVNSNKSGSSVADKLVDPTLGFSDAGVPVPPSGTTGNDACAVSPSDASWGLPIGHCEECVPE